MSTPQVLQHLYSLDISSPDLLRCFNDLIQIDDKEQYLSSLQGSELIRLVEILDGILDVTPITDDDSRRCLHKLQAICGHHKILPSSYNVSGDLARVGDDAVASGGFADVWEGTHDGRKVCIKYLRTTQQTRQAVEQGFYNESVMWKRLRHPNIVGFIGVTRNPLQFVSEWMPNGTLTEYLDKNPRADRIGLLLDVAEGLAFLHAIHTTHGDLKGPNVLIDHSGHARLADFGFASVVRGVNSVLVTEVKGYSARWAAPEVLGNGDRKTREADVFALGMIVIEVFTGRHPFSEFAGPATISKIMAGERPGRPQDPGLTDLLWDLTLRCWDQDPIQRPPMTRVVGIIRECCRLRSTEIPVAPLPDQGLEYASPTVLTAQTSPTPSGESNFGFGDLIDGDTRTLPPAQFTKSQPGLKDRMSEESPGESVTTEPGTLWIHSVSQEIASSVSEKEKMRQEAINEIIYTERDFVRDMECLRDTWIKPLKESDILPVERRTNFLELVFWNIHDIIAVHTGLRDALNTRQKSHAVVEQVGDILLDAIPHFSPYVSYGTHQLYGRYEFEKEKSSNPAFSAFVEAAGRRPESRNLGLNEYLTKPTTRLAQYPLLLEAVLKRTPDSNPDKVALPKVVAMIREFLEAVNSEPGKTDGPIDLLQLDQALVFKPGEEVDLRLKEEGREVIYEGTLNTRGTGQGEGGDLMVFLFDHALLLVKPKTKAERYKVHCRPIPLELLLISAPDDCGTPSVRPRGLLRNLPTQLQPGNPKSNFSITMVHLGRKFYQITLWASSYVSQRKLVYMITKQAEKHRTTVFDTATISEGFFVGMNRVNCAAPFCGGKKVVYGTDDGLYLSDFRERNRDPVKVLGLRGVLQVDVLEDYQLLVVLSERQVITFPLDALDHMDPLAGLKRAKQIALHVTFFKTGVCLGKTVVCVVKSSPLSSTIKVLEPIDQNIRGGNKPTFRRLLQGGNDTLRVLKEFYIPLESSSIHFLRTRLCVGCPNGFEIVDLETLDTQGLLDPADESLDFVRRRKSTLKPMAIYRIENEFLLCYDELAFYIKSTGRRSRKEFMVCWEGSPTGFALNYPYILAFEPTFVEIRHVHTGAMAQVIQGNNLRLLFADKPLSTTNDASQSANPYQQPHRLSSILGDEILLASGDQVMRVKLAQQVS